MKRSEDQINFQKNIKCEIKLSANSGQNLKNLEKSGRISTERISKEKELSEFYSSNSSVVKTEEKSKDTDRTEKERLNEKMKEDLEEIGRKRQCMKKMLDEVKLNTLQPLSVKRQQLT